MGQIDRRKRVTRIEAVWHATDVISVVGGFVIGHLIRFSPPFSLMFRIRHGVPPLRLYLAAGLAAAVLWILLFHALGLYRAEGTRRALRTPVLARASGLGMLINAGIAFFYREQAFSRLAALLIWIVTLILLRTLRRTGLRMLVAAGGVPPIRFALVGCNDSGLRLAAALPRAGVVPHELCGVVHVGEDAPVPEGVADLGAVDRLAETADRIGLDRVLVALSASEGETLERIAAICREKDIDLDVLPGLAFPFRQGIQVEEVAGLPIVRGKRLPLAGWNNVAKRTLDIVVSGFLLVLLSPILLACAIAVKLDSRGPVFYRQTRMGRDRRAFEMLKFRSMKVDAEVATGPVWAEDNDPRRTRVGTFLRTWSLDELPQLWNVLVGEMSLVGPRPERPRFVEEFLENVPDYWGRHRIKSGLTGWAQVNGLRGNSPIAERTKYDLYYIENWSLWLDLRILFLTARAVIAHKGS